MSLIIALAFPGPGPGGLGLFCGGRGSHIVYRPDLELGVGGGACDTAERGHRQSFPLDVDRSVMASATQHLLTVAAAVGGGPCGLAPWSLDQAIKVRGQGLIHGAFCRAPEQRPCPQLLPGREQARTYAHIDARIHPSQSQLCNR